MIQTEILSDRLIRTYSTSGYKIRQIETDAIYDEAVDVRPCRYTYEETDELIGGDDDVSAEETLEALEELL